MWSGVVREGLRTGPGGNSGEKEAIAVSGDGEAFAVLDKD
jgi:hypothetical protein